VGRTLGAARITVDGESVIFAGEPSVSVSGAEVRLPPGAFLQASRESEAAMVALVNEGVGRSKRVADLFAGIGTFTFALAENAEVEAYEQDEAAIAALAQAARVRAEAEAGADICQGSFPRPAHGTRACPL
jgi:23S rRNA (uracil1939-C5)-methyltransferase